MLDKTAERNRELEMVRQPQTIEQSMEASDSYEEDTNGEGSGNYFQTSFIQKILLCYSVLENNRKIIFNFRI